MGWGGAEGDANWGGGMLRDMLSGLEGGDATGYAKWGKLMHD